MRPFIILSIMVALFTGCSKKNTPAETSAAPVVEALDWDKPPQPPAVLKLADAWLASLHADQTPSDADEARREFVRCFFGGFTIHNGTMGLKTEAEKQGFKAGQDFRKASPDKLKETMESYGYVATEAEGTWTVRFEHSGFKPRDKSDEKEWWFSTLADTVSDLPEGGIPESGVAIRVSGFLSPQGHHGHFGIYPHAFYVTKISKVGG